MANNINGLDHAIEWSKEQWEKFLEIQAVRDAIKFLRGDGYRPQSAKSVQDMVERAGGMDTIGAIMQNADLSPNKTQKPEGKTDKTADSDTTEEMPEKGRRAFDYYLEQDEHKKAGECINALTVLISLLKQHRRAKGERIEEEQAQESQLVVPDSVRRLQATKTSLLEYAGFSKENLEGLLKMVFEKLHEERLEDRNLNVWITGPTRASDLFYYDFLKLNKKTKKEEIKKELDNLVEVMKILDELLNHHEMEELVDAIETISQKGGYKNDGELAKIASESNVSRHEAGGIKFDQQDIDTFVSNQS